MESGMLPLGENNLDSHRFLDELSAVLVTVFAFPRSMRISVLPIHSVADNQSGCQPKSLNLGDHVAAALQHDALRLVDKPRPLLR
jgi:hypothetical protein